MIISLSTAEAEYDALTSMGKEAMRLKSLIEDIFGPQKLPSILYIDTEAHKILCKLFEQNEAQSSEQSDNQISEVTNDQTIEMRSQNVHQKADESDIQTHQKGPGIDTNSIAKQNQNIDSNSIAKQNKRQNVNIKSATQKRQKVDTNSATQKRQKVDTNSNPFSKRDTNSHQIQHRYATRGNIAHQVNHAFLTYQNSSTTHYNTVDIVHQAHIAGLTVSLYKQNLKSKKNSHNIEEVPCALFNSTSGCRHKRSHTAGNKFLVHRKPKSKIEKDKLLYFMQTNQLIPCRIP